MLRVTVELANGRELQFVATSGGVLLGEFGELQVRESGGALHCWASGMWHSFSTIPVEGGGDDADH